MSLQQKRTELLTYGYVKNQTHLAIPAVIVQLIQLFYDLYFYWNITGENMQKFINAKNGEKIKSVKAFKIKGIEVKYVLYPNSRSNADIGSVEAGMYVRYLPDNIEYIGIYFQLKCEEHGSFYATRRWSKQRSATIGMLSKLDNFKDLKEMHLNCFTEIKYIKYKSNCDKTDYLQRPIKMHKKIEYEWNINPELMVKCKGLKEIESIESDKFDDNNWNLELFPNQSGETEIYWNCFTLPINIKKMEIKYHFIVDDDIENEMDELTDFVTASSFDFGCRILSFDEFKMKQSISIKLVLQIINLWNDQDTVIDINNWPKYGVIW